MSHRLAMIEAGILCGVSAIFPSAAAAMSPSLTLLTKAGLLVSFYANWFGTELASLTGGARSLFTPNSGMRSLLFVLFVVLVACLFVSFGI
jgi:hypothetical protein